MSNKDSKPVGELIVRHRAKGYMALPADILFDKEVSIKERGIYMTIMALPIDEEYPDKCWRMSINGLASILPDGKDAIGAALKGLQRKGYVAHLPQRDEKGKITGTVWHVYDRRLAYFTQSVKPTSKPQTENPHTDNPQTENPHTEKPDTENPLQFKYTNEFKQPINTHTHTVGDASAEEETKKYSDEDQKVIDAVQRYIHEKCADLELRFEPLTDDQILYLQNKNIGLSDIAKYLKDIQCKQLNYMVGASLCRLVEKFHENDFTLRKKKK